MLADRLLLENMVPLTSAFVGVQRQIKVEEDEQEGTQPCLVYDELLISRRSRFRAGTRFTKRGADATGSVANYAETEQVCILLQNITVSNNHLKKGKKSKKPKQQEERQQQFLDRVCSHVQIRGSIPLRWSSPTDIKTYRPRVRIGIDPVAQTRALLAHVLEQLSLYTLEDDDKSLNNFSSLGSKNKNLTAAKLIFVNLIDKKSDQGRLGRAFDAVLNAVLEVYAPPNVTTSMTALAATSETQPESGSHRDSNTQVITLEPNSVEHVWFDFHAEVKNGRWDRLAKLLKQIEPALLDHGYFCAAAPNQGSPDWKVLKQQRGVVRTNCLDNLDRTNAVQSLFGRFALFHKLEQCRLSQQGQDIEGQIGNSTNGANNRLPLAFVSAFNKSSLALPWTSGEVSHRLLWADNGDAISRLYAGTPALKGDFTRTGKRTKLGALDDGMNSLQRYYLNNFLDADRQEGTDLMVGYAPFSNLDDAPATDSSKEGKGGDTDRNEMTLQEAARQLLLGKNVLQSHTKDDDDDDEQSFARIKSYKEHHPFLRKSLDNVNGGASTFAKKSRLGPRTATPANGAAVTDRPLDLRWLPGDLQDHMRSRAIMAANDEAGPNAKFNPVAALASMDRRAATDVPWWVLPDTTDDENEDENGLIDHDIARTDPGAKKIPSGYVLSSFLLGTRAPTWVAAAVVAMLGVVLLHDSDDNSAVTTSTSDDDDDEDV